VDPRPGKRWQSMRQLGGLHETIGARASASGWQANRTRASHGLNPIIAGSFAALFIGNFMRLLHTMLRVGNLQRSIDFYTQVLGMQLLRTSENPEYKYSLAFVGYEGNPAQAEIELTYNWGTEHYEMGTAYGHIALGVTDAYAACEKIRAAGGNVTREAGPVKGGKTVIAFVTDPDGYKIELIQRPDQAAGQGLG